MANLITFDAKFKWVGHKQSFNLMSALFDASSLTSSYTNALINSLNCAHYTVFVDKVVNTVKRTHLEARNPPTCEISLETNNPDSDSSPTLVPPFPDFTPHLLIAVARALYRSYGIEIKQVDAMTSPRKIVVTWHRDHPILNPSFHYSVKSRKEGFLTDCTLKFENQLFPAHRIVLAAKSIYFETMFKGGFPEAQIGAVIPIVMDGLEQKSVEMLLDYFYTGELDLANTTVIQIENLLRLSSYFVLPHLEQLCFEYLCKSVNPSNVKDYVVLTRNHENKELEDAIIEHLKKEVTIDNIEDLIQLDQTDNIEGLEACSIDAIEAQIKKIDYEPCGFGKSSQLEHFVKFLDFAVKIKSPRLLNTIAEQIRKVLSHPGYGAHLEKSIEYLALMCQYQSCSLWLPNSEPNCILTMKNELHQDVLRSIKLRGTEQYKNSFSWPLVKECLEVAEKYQLDEITNAWSDVLTKKVHGDPENHSTILELANQFNLTKVKEAFEEL
ncbi:MAG: BTB/POZ domain-containing protein [Rhabdochlamydiaceae bacterium]|nr:BTB/POZ domain-containing protein [Rhabdochlamydiaceae bacterium]